MITSVQQQKTQLHHMLQNTSKLRSKTFVYYQDQEVLQRTKSELREEKE